MSNDSKPSESLRYLKTMTTAGKVQVPLSLSLSTMRRFSILPVLPNLIFIFLAAPLPSESRCSKGCDLAMASYYVEQFDELDPIASYFGILYYGIDSKIMPYNPDVLSRDFVLSFARIRIPFSCNCIDGEYLANAFQYNTTSGDNYTVIAQKHFANLTSPGWLASVNTYPPNNIPNGATINVTVNCSCGDSAVSEDYGLFLTYPLRPGLTLDSVASEINFTNSNLLQEYNQGVNFSSGSGLVFLPTNDSTGSFRPLKSSKGLSGGAIAALSIAALVLLSLAVFSLVVQRRRKQRRRNNFEVPFTPEEELRENTSSSMGIAVDRSVEFSYDELARATDDFSLENIIGSGGFGDVFYAELRGEKTAIKKMDVQSAREFLAELNVLTRVYHVNLVRLIGFCIKEHLFLIYEYIQNGNLSEHLRGTRRPPLSWSSRVRIALDSARGLEYIHEHSEPVYIHRDIKSPNILLDLNFHAKIADFGLAKLTKVGRISRTRLVGTFGYMPPEYRYGDVSPRVDVYAFGVVLYELISAKEAIITTNESIAETQGLVELFKGVLNQPEPTEELRKLVDPRLGVNYPIDAICKMALLGKACTEVNPQSRPNMRSIVVSLMKLSSSTADWDASPFNKE